MGTRANIIVKDGVEELWFYRHYDGYPEGTLPTLERLMDWVRRGVIRDNISQFSGWLIWIGAHENNTTHSMNKEYPEASDIPEPSDWKVGTYEPTTGRHGDIEYLYTIDLREKTITYKKV